MYIAASEDLPTAAISKGRANTVIIGIVMLALIIAGLVYVGVCLSWTLGEALQFIESILLLWAPIAVLSFVALADEVREPAVRFCLSVGVSYTLTVVSYFGFSVLNIPQGFYVLQAVAVVGAVLLLWRRSRSVDLLAQVKQGFRPDLFLLLILVGTLVVNIRYQVAFTVNPDNGDRNYNVFGDHLYYAGLAYALEQHVPPLQASVAGGLPERAYHMFPHLTTAMLAIYTRQDDMVRVQLVYHYIVIELLLCLLPYALGRVLTRSKLGGYLAAMLMYLLLTGTPAIVPNAIGYFYFTLFPQMTSGLLPAIQTSPQTYSSLVVLYTTFLGMALVARRYAEHLPHTILLLLMALCVAAGFRFRIQMYAGVAPAFILLLSYMALRGGLQLHLVADLRKTLFMLRGRMRFSHIKFIYFLFPLLTAAVSWLLYREMSNPFYLPGIAGVGIGFNNLTVDPNAFFNSWPFAPAISAWLTQSITDQTTRQWIWQAISMTAFSLLNVIGVPLLLATLYCYLNKRARRDLSLYNWFTFLVLAISIAGSILILVDYDPYSVAGQIPFQTRWYLFPFAVIPLCAAAEWLQKRLRWPSGAWIVLAIFCVFNIQQFANATNYDVLVNVWSPTTIPKAEYDALLYIRANTPANAVIMTQDDLFRGSANFSVSGISGRSAYMEKAFIESIISGANNQNREQIIQTLWGTADAQEFCQTLLATPATHMMVDMGSPPAVLGQQSCMERVWTSSDERVTLWQILHA